MSACLIWLLWDTKHHITLSFHVSTCWPKWIRPTWFDLYSLCQSVMVPWVPLYQRRAENIPSDWCRSSADNSELHSEFRFSRPPNPASNTPDSLRWVEITASPRQPSPQAAVPIAFLSSCHAVVVTTIMFLFINHLLCGFDSRRSACRQKALPWLLLLDPHTQAIKDNCRWLWAPSLKGGVSVI